MTAQIIEGLPPITRPQPDEITSSILDHATVVEPSRSFAMRNNEGLWDSYNCLDLLVPTVMCPRPIAEADFKTFSVAGWVPGFEFAVHGGVQCSLVGLDQSDQQAEVERVFERSEGVGVEMALVLNRFVAKTDPPGSDEPFSPDFANWEAPVSINSGNGGLAASIGALEGYAAATYRGLPTLHLPRALVTPAFGAGLLVERDGKFFTKAGSKVAAGGGYDLPYVDNLTGVFDIFITGEVYVEKSPRLSFSTQTIPGDGSGTGSDQNGLGDNTGIALVERAFRVGVDCLVAKTSVAMWSGVDS